MVKVTAVTLQSIHHSDTSTHHTARCIGQGNSSHPAVYTSQWHTCTHHTARCSGQGNSNHPAVYTSQWHTCTHHTARCSGQGNNIHPVVYTSQWHTCTHHTARCSGQGNNIHPVVYRSQWHTSTHLTARCSGQGNNIHPVVYTSQWHTLCYFLASCPGAMESDYPVAEEVLKAEAPELPKETVVSTGAASATTGESSGIGGITFVQCSTGPASPSPDTSPLASPRSSAGTQAVVIVVFVLMDRLVGLVVKASALRVEDPGFKSHLCWDFSGVKLYQWLKNWHSSGYPVRRLAL